MKEFVKMSKELLDFIDKSPSAFHVIENIKNTLVAAGFCELMENAVWELKAGCGYYVVRGDSSLIAFWLPEGDTCLAPVSEPKGFHMVAAHSDSPCFKLKEHPEMQLESKYVRLNTEKYGGMIMSSWLDRPLSVAGRVIVREEDELVTKLVNVEKDLFVIPSLAIHMNREANKGVEYNPQVDMLPLFAGTEGKGLKSRLLAKVAKSVGVKEKDILGQDLFTYVREKGILFGANSEFILAPRLDDLQCVYAGLKAFFESKPEGYVNVLAIFDNEEVGSGSRQGADSGFLQDVLERICTGAGMDREAYLRLIADSFLISADNAHAVHPNHPEKSDPTNRPYLNGGLVIKYNAGQKYTTDGISAAYMKDLCDKAGVPYQTYTNRSDMPGGSTLGNISISHVSVASVDVGLPQLAMHSAVETAGVNDLYYAVAVFKEFYNK